MPNALIPQQQQPFIQPGFGAPQFQRSGSSSNQQTPRRHRRRRQVNIPPNLNFQQQQQQQQMCSNSINSRAQMCTMVVTINWVY